MLEDEMEITILRDENKQLINKIKELEEELNYSRCNDNRNNVHTNNICNNLSHLHNLDVPTEYNDFRMATEEESEQLANAYAEAMNINTGEELI